MQAYSAKVRIIFHVMKFFERFIWKFKIKVVKNQKNTVRKRW